MRSSVIPVWLCVALTALLGACSDPAPRPRAEVRSDRRAPSPGATAPPAQPSSFAGALVDIDSLRASDEPCPITLSAPPAEATTGESPGQAVLRAGGAEAGEPFEVVYATSGETLPTRAESSDRYQALYVRTHHVAPAVDEARGTFTAGGSQGRAYLIDVPAERIVCMGDIEARNGTTITGSSGRNAGMWLSLQLMMAEQRAIARGLFAVAGSEDEEDAPETGDTPAGEDRDDDPQLGEGR